MTTALADVAVAATALDTDHWVVSLDPVAFEFWFITIRWYALAYIAGLVLGWQYINLLLRDDRLWVTRHAESFPAERWPLRLGPITLSLPRLRHSPQVRKEYGVNPPARTDDIDDLLVWATIGVILGGRLGFVLFYGIWHEDFRESLLEAPWRVVAIWEGGMSFHGGLLGVVLAIITFSRNRGLDMFRVGDLAAVATPIGLFFGRIANFINGELWGKHTDGSWGVIFETERMMDARAGVLQPAEAYLRHPSQLYEAVGEGLLLFLVLYVGVRVYRILDRPGLATGIFLIGYGLARGTVEFWRESVDWVFYDGHWFTMGMLLSIPMIFIGIAFILKSRQADANASARAQTG